MNTDRPSSMARLARGVRVVLRNDGSAYGYSLLATSTFGLISAQEGPPVASHVFLFVAAAAGAFALAEMLGSNLFRQRIRPERSEVVLLASALNPLSAVAGVGAAALVDLAVDGWIAWVTAPFVATAVYILLTGANMTAAIVVEERTPPRETR